MTPRYESAAPTLDTGTEDDIIENPEGANIIRITADELAHGRQSQGNAVEGEAEFYRRAITKGKLDAGRTVRSDYAYDFDSTDPVPPQVAARATGIKAELGDEPLHGIENRYAYRFVKRAFDLVFSAAVIVALSWLFVIIAVAIKIDDPKGPVFFKQLRCTKANRQFYMLKFRSMCVDAEERLAELQKLNEKSGPVFKIADDPRITRVGKWLRKLSLDELPQFINVLKGDIPLRILKTRPEFSEKSMGAFALPAKTSTNKVKVFSQVVSCFANGLRMHRISLLNCNCIGDMKTQFLAKPVFGVSPVHPGTLFQKSNNGLAKAAW